MKSNENGANSETIKKSNNHKQYKIKACLVMGMYILTGIGVLCLAGCHNRIEEDIAGTDIGVGTVPSAADGERAAEELPETVMEFVTDRVSLKEYQSLYESEIMEIKESAYDNLSFHDCDIMPLPDGERVGVYRLYSRDMGVDESIAVIKSWLEESGCGEIVLEEELRDASGQYGQEEGREYPYNYPAVYEYYPAFDSGRGFFVNTGQCYIQMGSDGIYSMSDGSITAYLGLDSLAAMDALGINEENVVDGGKCFGKQQCLMGTDRWRTVCGGWGKAG